MPPAAPTIVGSRRHVLKWIGFWLRPITGRSTLRPNKETADVERSGNRVRSTAPDTSALNKMSVQMLTSLAETYPSQQSQDVAPPALPFPNAPFAKVAHGAIAAIQNTARRLRAAGASWVYSTTARDAQVFYMAVVRHEWSQRSDPNHRIGCLVMRASDLGAELQMSPMVRMRAVRLACAANVLRVHQWGDWIDGRPTRLGSRFLLSCHQLSHDAYQPSSTASGVRGYTSSTASGACIDLQKKSKYGRKRSCHGATQGATTGDGRKPAWKAGSTPTHRPNGHRVDPSQVSDAYLSSCPHTPRCTSALRCHWIRMLDAQVAAGRMTPAQAARMRGWGRHHA
jgi:hypothetical protein